MEITFEGGEADRHHIDLYNGSESLSGIGRAANLVGHYVATGEVRYRAPYSDKIRFFLTGTERGSLSIVISEVSRVGSEIQNAAAKIRASKLLRRVVRRATGQAEEGPLRAEGVEYSAGDIDALAEAATPGLLRAHRWIDSGRKSITLSPEVGREVKLDSGTKEYLETEEVSEEPDLIDVSVGALNVNARTGRVYFHDLGRTVPFYVPRDASPRTIPTLSRFLTQYAEKTGATVNINYRRVDYADERLKRIIIYDAYPIAGLA
jgi:hypothetical protein